ncbi:MAG: ketopantoate reductase family protein [Gemmatimonadaceae bacterium]
MRILVVGAGAIGGYFGGRLLEAGCDVTFLLRARRAAQFEASGLVIKSRLGDFSLLPAPYLLAEDIGTPFDLVVVSCKAYDLEQTMESFAPAVGSETAILPLLNGLRHVEELEARFGRQCVLGGLCMISATLDPSGVIVHLNDLHRVSFGELDGTRSSRIARTNTLFARAKFEAHASTEILQEMWEKWIFIASLGGINTLARASVGDIVTAGAVDLATALYDECSAIARFNDFPPRAPAVAGARAVLTTPGSSLTASLLKDIERGAPTEGEHIIGDLYRRAPHDARSSDTSLLRTACAAVRAYEVRRARENLPA